MTTLNDYEVNSIFTLIRIWAAERNLIEGSTTDKQMLKLVEEVGELAAGLARNDRVKILDSLGDVCVVLTILAAQCRIPIEHCLNGAYNEIKDRKGKMIDGVFVKEEDLIKTVAIVDGDVKEVSLTENYYATHYEEMRGK